MCSDYIPKPPCFFICSTRPPSSRIVRITSGIGGKSSSMLRAGTKTFPFFRSIQSSFYVEQKDVTKPEILMQIAADIGIDAKLFLRVYESDEAKKQISIHFNKVRRWGIHSFPTVIVQNAAGYSILNRGYCSLEALCVQLDDWLNT